MLPRRRSIRLPGYDYAQPGAYFITVCTAGRRPVLASVVGDEAALSPAGRAVLACWEAIPRHFTNVDLDAFVIMPNHIHGIVTILPAEGVGAKHLALSDASPARVPDKPRGTRPGSLAAVVQNLKSVSARRVNALRGRPGEAVWQRGYFERVIRTDKEMNALREYILGNPARWAEDEYYSRE